MLGVIDAQARLAVKGAQQDIAPIVAREVPRKSGKTAAALRPRVSRTATGAALIVAAPRAKVHDGQATIADVVRWVNRGTGLYRDTPGPKKSIRSSRRPPRRMTLPGGMKRWTVKGQRPNEFMARIRALGTPRFEAACQTGAQDAARSAERVIG
jgi:hypothetical protein